MNNNCLLMILHEYIMPYSAYTFTCCFFFYLLHVLFFCSIHSDCPNLKIAAMFIVLAVLPCLPSSFFFQQQEQQPKSPEELFLHP